MRAFDAYAIAQGRTPGLVLMESAGRGAADLLERELLGGIARGKRIAVVCGTGNNGGDGFVIARHLLARGAVASALAVGDPARMTSDARSQLDAWIGAGGTCRWMSAGTPAATWDSALSDIDVVVDALLGTGLTRPVEGVLADAVRAVNAAAAHRFAVDVPSGLDADTGGVLGVAVKAAVTATFAYSKLGLLTPTGASLAGKRVVVDIGVPASVVEHLGAVAQQLTTDDLRDWLPRRGIGAHKTNAGHVLVLGGSRGKTGASKLVARGAMRAGAGLVTVGTWPEAADAIEATAVEVMTARIDPLRITECVDAALAGKHAVVVGPGFGVSDDVRTIALCLIRSWRGPLIVDADALSALADNPTALRPAMRAVLTPHPGELARLLGRSTGDVEADRFRAARDAVDATGAVVVLKGAHTVIAAPDGRLSISPVACPILATGGSGDVLAGVIGALACALPPFEAACAGVLLHGFAGEAWARAHRGADRGMLASEIADRLPSLIASLQ
jgi:NAD(P)H-hydrate epimerase